MSESVFKRVRTTPDDEAPLSPQEAGVATLIGEAQAWCGSHGLVMVAPNRTDGSWQHAPVALTPATFPRSSFEQAVALARPFNALVDVLARDPDFIVEGLADAIKGDEFTKRLVDIYEKFGGPRARQQAYLAVHRSDYMVDTVSGRLLQIELNTISSSFACLSARVTRLHRFLLTGNPTLRKLSGLIDSRFANSDAADLSQRIPENRADTIIPRAIAKAHELYDSKRKEKSRNLCVLFVVQENERNYVDQRHLEYELCSSHKVPVLRRTLGEVEATGKLQPDTKALILEGDKEISVAYFRSGYTPTDYPTEVQWAGREKIEESLAIKCPSIAYHLVGAKKIQQRLADPGVLEKYVLDKDSLTKLKACFAGLWSMGADFDPAVRAKAIADPIKYVIKPQREGGGNNIYGDKVRVALETMPAQEQAAHILMERIFPPREDAFLMRNAEVQHGPALSELGIYSVYLGDGKMSYLDEEAGHLLRTKFDGVDEGGVAGGFASLNSPLLS